MAIPFLIIAFEIGAGLFGVSKSIEGSAISDHANDLNARSEDLVRRATARTETFRQNANEAINELWEEKAWALNNSLARFVSIYEKQHGVDFDKHPELDNMEKFGLDRQFFKELKKSQSISSDIISGAVAGVGAGTAGVLGAYGFSTVLGTASTGTAINLLNGIASKNATLSFLGGGAIKAGGLGIAGGEAILGGLMTGAALAVFGFVESEKAKTRLDDAWSNIAEAYEYAEEMKNVQIACEGIRRIANMYDRLLIRLDGYLYPLTLDMDQVVEVSGTDSSVYFEFEDKIFAQAAAIAKAMKTVIDTPIIAENGEVNEDAWDIAEETKEKITSFENGEMIF